MTDDNLLGSIKNKLLDNSLELIASIISISAISYVLSRIFIKLYLQMIGFESLGYSALSNNDTSSLFFFGILIILLSVILLSALVPACLRQIYLESKTPNENADEKTVRYLIVASFIIVLISCIIFIIYKQSLWVFIFIAIPPVFLFIYRYFSLRRTTILKNMIFIHNNETVVLSKPKPYIVFNTSKYLIKYIFTGLLFALTMTLLIAPCILLIVFIDQSKFIRDIYSSNYLVISVALLIWLIYSFSYGSRISKLATKHYLYDIAISFAFLYFLALINISTFVMSIAQFVDIKDKTTNLYKIHNDDYKQISKEINHFWQDKYVSIPTSYKCQPLQKTINDYTFLQAQIIFRDNNIVVMCPPNTDIINENTDQCFIVDQSKITSTSKSISRLLTDY